MPTVSSMEDPDERERVWLMCQAGILPARIEESEVFGVFPKYFYF